MHGAHHHHQIDTAGQRRPIARAAGYRVAARGRNEWAGRAPTHAALGHSHSGQASAAAKPEQRGTQPGRDKRLSLFPGHALEARRPLSRQALGFAGPSPEPADARDDTFPPLSSRALFYRDLDQPHGHGPAGMCSREQFLGLPLILLGSKQVAQGPFHLVRHHQSPARPACRDGRLMRETRNGVAFQRTCEMNRHA